MQKLKLITDHPVAYESRDHIEPKGTANDNLHSINFVYEMIKVLGDDMTYLDLGTAGGGMVYDFLYANALACGIDGSDYSKKMKRANWGNATADYLFTADITKPFQFETELGELFKFRLITSFDVMEHMHNEAEAAKVIINIRDNLEDGGFTLHSIAEFEDEGYHHILENKGWWVNLFESNGFRHAEIIEERMYARTSSHNLTFQKV